MTKKRLVAVLGRVAPSVIFAGVFYTGWMAVAIPITKSGFGGSAAQAVMWILAPIVTGLGFAAGLKIFELLTSSYKTGFWEIYMWSLAGCAIGCGIVWGFGPMLIVFGMFVIGTLSVVLHEVAGIKRKL